MRDDLVSVVIPTYNRAHSVINAIESALHQTHSNVEALVVDDGSTDNTEAVIRREYENEPRVRYLYQPQSGVSAARNSALRVAEGQYIAFLDSDDAWYPWKLELQLKCMEFLPQAVMTWSDMEAVDSFGGTKEPSYLRKMYSAYDDLPGGELFDQSYHLGDVVPELSEIAGSAKLSYGSLHPRIVLANYVHTPTVLIRRDKLKQLHEFDETLEISGEDHDFHIRTCAQGPVALIDLPTIRYLVGADDQLTHESKQKYMAQNYINTLNKSLKGSKDLQGLSGTAVKTAYSNAYAWLGISSLEHGDSATARRSLLASLIRSPLQARRWAFLVLACLPKGFRESIRGGYAALKAKFTGIRKLVSS